VYIEASSNDAQKQGGQEHTVGLCKVLIWDINEYEAIAVLHTQAILLQFLSSTSTPSDAEVLRTVCAWIAACGRKRSITLTRLALYVV